MADFSLFDDALSEYNDKIINKEKDNTETTEYDSESDCNHLNYTEDNGIVCCTDCGIELGKNVFPDKEWRFYGQSDNKRTSDPNRVLVRKMEDRNIFKDVENMGFSDKIVSLANQLYIEVTKGHIYRGNSRKAIIFACIFHSFKVNGKAQTHDNLIKIFEIDRKNGLKGLKHVALNIPKDSIIHNTYITPVNLIEDIMDKFNATDAHKAEVLSLYDKIKNKSSKINRSRPQSVSSGLIYYWICIKGLEISLKDFAVKTGLSELTISKITQEIARVLNTPLIL